MKDFDLEFLDNIWGKLKKYLININEDKVITTKNPKDLINNFDFSLKNPTDFKNLEIIVDYIFQNAVKTSSNQYHNQLFAGTQVASLAGDFITSAINTSNYTFEVSPFGTLMEIELIKKMSQMAGFKYHSGTFLTGGSNANLLSILLARHDKFPSIKENGINSIGDICLFVSEEAHYSFEKAVNLMGIGKKNLICIKSNKGIIDINDLKNKIQYHKKIGNKAFYLAATAGTTEIGAFDPIDEISEICKENNLWFHVDGAWGASVLVSQKHKSLMKGIEKADSLAWDPHKLLNIPLICSVLLVNKEYVLADSLSIENGDYLFHNHSDSIYDLGKTSLQCGRRVDSMKFWMAWKNLGDSGLESNINHLFEIKENIISYLTNFENIEILADTPFLNINFRFIENNLDLNSYNLKIRDELINQGEAMCNYCHLDGNFSFRLIINNPDKSFDDYKIFFNLLFEAKEIIDKSIN